MFNKKLSRNRRGEDMIIDFWAILIFAVIILGFFLVFAAEKSKITKNIETEFQNKDTDYMLQSFLRAPLTDDPEKTVSDVIMEDTLHNDFTNTTELFNNFFQRTTMLNSNEVNDILIKIDWNTKTKTETKNLKMTTTASGSTGFLRAFSVILQGGSLNDNYAETYIPGFEGKILVTLRVSEKVFEETAENENVPATGTPAANTQTSTTTPGTGSGNNQLNMPGSANNPIN